MIRAISRAGILLLVGAWPAPAQHTPGASRPAYPATRVATVVDDYHGTRVRDPYRWLEELEAPDVREWAAAQTALALPYFRDHAVRPWLLTRVQELDELVRLPSLPRPAREPSLMDASSLGAGESLEGAWPSPDRRHVAYQVSTAGSPWPAGRIRRVADGTDLAERLMGLDGQEMSWTRDGRGFFYVRSTTAPPDGQARPAGPGVFYHALGTPQSHDMVILRVDTNVTDVSLEHALSADGRFLFVSEGTGPYVDQLGHVNARLHVLDLQDPLHPAIGTPLVSLSGTRDAAYHVVTTRGDSIYLFTDHGAPRRRVVVFTLAAPAAGQWRDVVPPSEDVIARVAEIHGRLVVTFVRNVQHGVRVYERDGRLVRELPIPPMATITSIRADSAGALVVRGTEGFVPMQRRYDLADGDVPMAAEPPVPSAVEPYEIRQVWYTSRDGARVPMFVAHRRGLVLDGSHATILSGYGASSSIETPNFGIGAIAPLELGFVLAAPAVRGGGEFGREWYEAAILGRKQTTFDDFIAAAEFLIREGYTSADRLAIMGGSNGGLLVTSVINQRPDLFRVAIAHVPPTDLLRFDPGTHRAQYGSPLESAHLPFLLWSSSFHNVRAGTCYPATLLTTAFDDTVVPAWNALKLAAALQAAQSCDRPVLLRADPDGGHGGLGLGDLADAVGFIAGQLGMRAPPRPAQ